MDGKYTFDHYVKDLDSGYKIKFNLLKNKYLIYKVNDDCYMQELIEQLSRNPVAPKQMITYKAIKMNFPYMLDIEYDQ